jgi:hypothetical protein
MQAGSHLPLYHPRLHLSSQSGGGGGGRHALGGGLRHVMQLETDRNARDARPLPALSESDSFSASANKNAQAVDEAAAGALSLRALLVQNSKCCPI